MREFAGGWLTLVAGTPWWLVWCQRLALLLLCLLIMRTVVNLFRRPA